MAKVSIKKINAKKSNNIGIPHEKKKFRFNVAEILEKAGCNPFQILADISMGINTGVDKRVITPRLRLEAAAELAQYVCPKLKAIDHSNSDGSSFKFNINFSHPVETT